MTDSPTPLLSVSLSKDGVWSVNERRCRVAVLENDGAVRVARDYP